MPVPASGPAPNPLEGIERVLVDGSNLVHALRRSAPNAAPVTLIGRLRGVIEPSVRIELVFDGPPDRGLGNVRIASGLTVHYSGRVSADSRLIQLVSEALEPAALLVVTDDGELRREVGRRGARTTRAQWLIGRLDRARLAAPAIGRPKPPAPAPSDAALEDESASARWNPGRGATTKRGNAHHHRKSRPLDRR